MSGQHTPGPWTAEASAYSIQFTIRDDVGYAVARVATAADTALIAATPDLMAALKVMLDLHITHHNHPCRAAARGIIARAEGAA